MKSKTEKILGVLHIISWIALIGYAITCGAQIATFIVSFKNPEASKLIPGIEPSLLNVLQNDFRIYVSIMTLVIALSLMVVVLWLMVITLLSKLNIKSPFTIQVARQLERLAYTLFSIWLVAFAGDSYVGWVTKRLGEALDVISIGNEFLFVAGIVYIISQIFKHGVEIQDENQQTI